MPSRFADGTISLFWDMRYKVWRVVARGDAARTSHSVTANTTCALDQVLVQRLAHVVRDEMEAHLF